MENQVDIEDSIEDLHRRWNAITERPPVPRSTMDVIEYGLGSQQRAEVYLNRLLCYLLDPEQPHGMGTDFLAAFLDGLPQDCGFNEDTYNLEDVRVNEQVPVWETATTNRSDDVSPGYLDLLLDIPNEWFLLIELKFSAPEEGTEFYCTASQIGEHEVSEYSSGQYYLYLHQADRPEASGECFVNWTWQSFIDDVLEDFLAEQASYYPQRTAAQLHDLKDDVESIAGMTDRSDSDSEKVELYLEHAEAITDVTEAFEDEWESFTRRWGEEMQDSLVNRENRVSAAAETDDGYPAVSVARSDGKSERWILRDSGGDWQHVFKHGWRLHETEGDVLEKRADDKNDLRIGFYHRMQDNRETAVKNHQLRFNFRCMGSNPSEFTDIYKNHFDRRLKRIEDALESTKASTTGNKLTLVKGTYPIEVNDHETFFEAYTDALADAFIDVVVENPRLVRLFGEAFKEALSDYRQQSHT